MEGYGFGLIAEGTGDLYQLHSDCPLLSLGIRRFDPHLDGSGVEMPAF